MNAATLPYITTKSRYWSPKYATSAAQFAELTARIAGFEFVVIHWFGKEIVINAYKRDGSQSVVRLWNVDRNRVKEICSRPTTRHDVDNMVSQWVMKFEQIPYELVAMLNDITLSSKIRQGDIYLGASVQAAWEVVLPNKHSGMAQLNILPRKLALTDAA